MCDDQHPGVAFAAAAAAATSPSGAEKLLPETKQRPRGGSGSGSSAAVAGRIALFAFFVLTRAVHPLLIDASKESGRILYAKNTPIIMNKILTLILMNMVGLALGGVRGLRQCWRPECLAVFGLIGAVYAIGDILEMLSMARLTGGVYQILLQSKLIITALMLQKIKGTRQSSLQWHLLLAMFLGMSAFVLVDRDGDEGGSSGAGSVPVLAMCLVMMKVTVSCLCAVMSEKYMKAYNDLPVYAKISGLSTTWTVASLLMCFVTEPQVIADGFFAGWSPATWLVMVSFIVKTVSTMYILQALDSVQKNIGEALAVLVIYVSQVSLFGKAFQLAAFLIALLVVALVRSYLLSQQKPKAVAAGAPRHWPPACPTRAAATRKSVATGGRGVEP